MVCVRFGGNALMRMKNTVRPIFFTRNCGAFLRATEEDMQLAN